MLLLWEETMSNYAQLEQDQGADYGNYKPGDSVEFKDGSEAGRCKVCRQVYTKTVGQANVSKSGYCYRHGFNP